MAWRGSKTNTQSSSTGTEMQIQKKPLAALFAKEFDLNFKSIRAFIYYSFLLAVSYRI